MIDFLKISLKNYKKLLINKLLHKIKKPNKTQIYKFYTGILEMVMIAPFAIQLRIRNR